MCQFKAFTAFHPSFFNVSSYNLRKYIESTNHHLMFSEPRLADGTIARLWPHVNTVWADDAFMALSFLVRMGEMTGDNKYFDDAANQILNYTRYLWCPEKEVYYLLSSLPFLPKRKGP